MKSVIRSISTHITSKYLLIFSLVLIIPTLAIYQVIMEYAKELMKDYIVQNNQIHAESIVKRLSSELNDVVLKLQLIAGLSNDQQLNEAAMFERAKQTISKSQIIHSIYFLDSSKRLRFEAPFSPEGNRITYEYPKFDHVRWSYTHVMSGLIKNFRNEQVVTVSIPVFYEDRKFQGVLVAELSREYLSEILKSMSRTRGGFAFLVDNSGKVIASTNESEWDMNYAGEPIVGRLMKGDSGTVIVEHQGEKSVMTYETMGENLGLALGIPERIAFEPISSLSKMLTAGYLIIFLLMLCMIVLGMRHILYPIVRLTQFAQYFHEKQTFPELPPLPVKSDDELAVLMRTMTSLAVKVEEKERFLREVIEGIPYALITLDQQGVITHINQNMTRLTGLSASSLKGKHISILPELTFLQNLPGESEISLFDTRKQKRIVRVVTTPFHDGVLAVLQDISQLKMLEAHARQSEKLALMGQITTGIAHELKNPLAVLSSTSELLKEEIEEDPSSDLVHTLVSDIKEETRRMSGIVSEFLTLARTRNENETVVEMDRLMDRVLHLLRIKFNESKVEVVRCYHRPLPPIKGKPNKLIQVFLNIILNSLDAMSSGGSIRIAIEKSEQWLTVTIADNGQGISEQDLKWLFNPFFTTKKNGNGLGLTIARDIVQEHGGDICIESAVNQGTTVHCRFPLNGGEEKAL